MRYGSLSTKDIEKSNPRLLHQTLHNKPTYGLCIQDIDGAIPVQAGFRRDKPSNPLQPVYKLQSYQ